jgi:hypothetical protein
MNVIQRCMGASATGGEWDLPSQTSATTLESLDELPDFFSWCEKTEIADWLDWRKPDDRADYQVGDSVYLLSKRRRQKSHVHYEKRQTREKPRPGIA